VSRGTCSFATRAQNAIHTGAVAMIVYNNRAGDLSSVTVGGSMNIVAVGIPRADGLAAMTAITNGATATHSASVCASDDAYFDGTSMATRTSPRHSCGP